jgi:C-terminal processing protease CtpA/Prc
MFLIAQYLNPVARPFAIFMKPDLRLPGSYSWTGAVTAGGGSPPPRTYPGRVFVLADERTLSHAEYTCMALRSAPQVTLVGSPTSGADGDIVRISLPGGLRTNFTGIGVFYPDRTPTQRVGIVPDVLVRPTRAGIAAGVDEVLERALDLAR